MVLIPYPTTLPLYTNNLSYSVSPFVWLGVVLSKQIMLLFYFKHAFFKKKNKIINVRCLEHLCIERKKII